MNDTITILGEPVAKERPRIGKHGGVYTPRGTKNFEDHVAIAARAQLPKYKALDRLIVSLDFYCSSGKKDLDNLCKSVLDGLQKGGTFKNDSQVVELHASKHVISEGGKPRTQITIRSFG